VTPPHNQQFALGTRVQIVPRDMLEEFRRTWISHHPLTVEQLAYAGQQAMVRDVVFYHGGDVLYTLDGVAGTWHEQCVLNSA
jgi:hypothetical protein